MISDEKFPRFVMILKIFSVLFFSMLKSPFYTTKFSVCQISCVKRVLNVNLSKLVKCVLNVNL